MKNSQSLWSRRKFLTAASIAAAGTAFTINPLFAWANDELDPRVANLVTGTIGIDAHNHIDVPLNTEELPGPPIDLKGALKKSGLSAICMTFATDYQKGDPYERFKNGMSAMDRQLKDNGITRALNLADLRAAHKRGQPTVIQSLEGSHFLEGKIERLKEAYDRGLRHLTLLHDSDAVVPLGDVFTNPARWGGLTAFGAEVIRECNRLGILVDLGHGSADMVTAALKVAIHPIIVSHTGLDTQLGANENMARMMKPRLISSSNAKAIAAAGGIIGVWTHLADSALIYAQNIRAMVEVVGIDHVCIGTDTKLTPEYRKPEGNAQSAQEGTKNRRAFKGSNETWEGQTNGFYYTVVDALLKTGFTATEIAKIGGGNFCRVFDASTKGHR